MIATTQKPSQAENSGTQTVGGCPDDVFRSQKAKDTDVVKPAKKSKQINSTVHRESDNSAQELIEQAYADYWTL